ncbi:MAG: hypothetical protein PWP31_1668 [Clostridia bacterium]|nr:hypothetical protein [Clostridia bacterium]
MNKENITFNKIPIRTHIITDKDNIIDITKKYCEGIAKPGDVIAIAESVVAITQQRAILPEDVHPNKIARFLCRFPGKDGSLATPTAMQLAISEVGLIRIFAGCAAAAFGKIIKKKGLFYIVAGRQLALIDDIAGTMYPYERHIVMGPKNPQKLVQEIKKATKAEVVIVDVNDKKCVDILGITDKKYVKSVKEALRDNPFGNEDEQTPIVILSKSKRKFN